MLQRRVPSPLNLILVPTLAVLLVIAAAGPAGASSVSTFSDTGGTSYTQAVDLLADAGVIEGCEEGRFCPNRYLTRAQMASLLVRALDVPAAENSARFTDIEGNTHADAIEALAAAGITEGCGEGRFCPDDTISRGQLASFLDRAFDPPATGVVWFDDARGVHGPAVNRLASAGIAAGCSQRLPDFCIHDDVLRWQTALFLARAMDLVERVQIPSLAERRAEQARIDAERERRRQEEAARVRQAERDRIWDRLADCESGGNWSINTGNGYYGGLQFSLSSWRWVGGSGYPHHHTREQQIYRAEILLQRQGWNAWPACSRKLGLR